MPRAPKKTETTPTVRVKRTRRKSDIQVTTPVVSEVEISQLAYLLYKRRGGVNGSPLDDWLEAERQLTSR
jgi:Protein of unknown function (DUF2934)